MAPQSTKFELWTPGPLNGVRRFLLSDNLQGALQLVVGILFVSLFVFVPNLQFPGSCVAVMLYIVVAVTAAPNNHIGTRIFTSGFMIGPMWLALSTGGIVSTLASLAPSPQMHMVILCTLGPLAIIPFAISRVGTSHPALWAMGMISTLYLGLPILVGFPTRDLGLLWQRSVLFIMVAALIAMFTGTVFAMIVLPSLASRKLEDEISSALQQLGQCLSYTASHLFRQPGQQLPLPKHLHNIHPLLLQQQQHMGSAVIAPGVLDKDLSHQMSPADVYAAVMDWFEHLSRPPPQQQQQQQQQQGKSRAGSVSGFQDFCRNMSASSGSSTLAKSTFYGPEAAGFAAAAVAAAAADSMDERADAELYTGNPTAVDHAATIAKEHSGAGHSSLRAVTSQNGCPHAESGASANALRLSSGVAAASFIATKVKLAVVGGWQSATSSAAANKQRGSRSSGSISSKDKDTDLYGSSGSPAERMCRDAVTTGPVQNDATTCDDPMRKETDSQTVCKDTGEQPAYLDARGFPGALCTALQPAPGISEARRALAQAFQLLEAAKAEPQWLLGAGRRFDAAAWAKVIAAAQQLALRLSALDLVYRDHASLSETIHSLGVGEPLEVLLKNVYGTAAAALSLLAAQVADRGDGWSPAAHKTAADIMQAPGWCDARQQLMQLLEQSLAAYWQRVQTASLDRPVTMQPAQVVRQWMFCMVATLGVLDALNSLASATASAVGPTKHGSSNSSSSRPRSCSRRNSAAKLQVAPLQQHQQPLLDEEHQQMPTGNDQQAAEGTAIDIEAAGTSAATENSNSIGPATERLDDDRQQQGVAGHQNSNSLEPQQQQQHNKGVCYWFKQLVLSHTGWMRPWLPLALNLQQFQHIYHTLGTDLPRMFSSRQAFAAQVKGRRFRAGVKYWFVCSAVLVAVLVLQYYVPISYKYAPNFGYSAAAVGMSDRVESTVQKVFVWTLGSVAGAVLGWGLMATPDMANDPVALAAIICCIAFLVGSLGKSRNMLVTLFTLMTVASVVLCQFVGCCGHTGSTEMAIVRGLSVTAAAVFSVAVQNLIWPWYTSSWAVEQLGQTYEAAAGVLADLVLQLYKDTDKLLSLQVQCLENSNNVGQDSGTAAAADDTAVIQQSIILTNAGKRFKLIDDAVTRVQQQLQQHLAATVTAESFGAPDGVARTASATAAFTSASAHAVHGTPLSVSQGAQPMFGSQVPVPASQANGGVAAAAGDGGQIGLDVSSFIELQMLQELLQQQQQTTSGCPAGTTATAAATTAAAAGGAKKGSGGSPAQLQTRIMRPLMQVKVSLFLDTTAWRSGPFATPPVVMQLLQCMFDLADALGALQHTLSLPVQQLSGSWYWLLQHTAKPWGQLLVEVQHLASATASHLGNPNDLSAAGLMKQIQEVQHKRFEFMTAQRESRRLLHIAMATDEQLRSKELIGDSSWHLEGQLKYSGSLYATAKVLDRITAVARCALEVKTKL